MFKGGWSKLLISAIVAMVPVAIGMVGLSTSTLAISNSARTRTNVNVGSAISISAPQSGELIDPNHPGQAIAPTPEGTTATYSENVIVSTNNLTGYTLYMSMGAGSSNNALNHTTKSNVNIPSITIDTTLANLPSNTWAYTLESGASATYKALPNPLAAKAEDRQHTLKADGQPGGETTTVSFATKVDVSKEAGQYQNSVLYTATTKEPPVLQPKAILGDNGNLNFVHDYAHYQVGDTYTDNLGETKIIAVYDSEHGYTFPYNPTSSSQIPWRGQADKITSANFDISFYSYLPISTAHWFEENSYLSNITNAQNFNTSSVTNMSYMFSSAGLNATTFSLDLSNWDTGNVTDMSYMFSGAGQNATTFSLDLSNWDTSNVADMRSMFLSVGAFSTTFNLEGIGNWDTSNVTNMSGMLALAYQQVTTFSLDLSNWDTGNVTDMSYMFSSAGKDATTFSLDLSNWDTSNVTDMSEMFSYAGKLKTVYVGDGWSTAKVETGAYMFDNAISLVGGAGTTYSSAHTDKEYARVDNPPNSPGYFTYKGSNPNTPSGEGDTVNNVTNVYNSTYNNSGTDSAESGDGYADPQGVEAHGNIQLSQKQPNWLLIILLIVLAISLVSLITVMIYKLRRQKKSR